MPVLLIVLLNYTVNYLLILTAAGLCRCPLPVWKNLLGAGVGAFHILLCMLPGLTFLKHTLWHILTIAIAGTVTFGRKQYPLTGALLVLHLGLDAIASDTGIKGMLAGLCAVILLWLLFRNRKQGHSVPVVLRYAERELALTALRDTGNCLRDPITGGDVLVIGPEAARKLTGLTIEQLKAPIQTMGMLPGLRLIPYNTVGNSGFLLGLKLNKVRIGSWQGSHMVAFAPMGLEGKKDFEALIGGNA